MVKQIIIGLFMAGLGGALLYFSSYLIEAFGNIDRADRHLGGTRNAYLLVGFGLMLIGMLVLFGMIPVEAPVSNLPGTTTGSLGLQ